MGNTFEFVIDRKAQYALKTKLNIMSEYYFVVGKQKNAKQDCDTYLFVVKPKANKSKDERDGYEGSFNHLRKFLDIKIT